MTAYQPHKPGEAPPKPPRDGNGVHVHRLAAKPAPDPCPKGLIRDPASGECVPLDLEG